MNTLKYLFKIKSLQYSSYTTELSIEELIKYLKTLNLIAYNSEFAPISDIQSIDENSYIDLNSLITQYGIKNLDDITYTNICYLDNNFNQNQNLITITKDFLPENIMTDYIKDKMRFITIPIGIDTESNKITIPITGHLPFFNRQFEFTLADTNASKAYSISYHKDYLSITDKDGITQRIEKPDSENIFPKIVYLELCGAGGNGHLQTVNGGGGGAWLLCYFNFNISSNFTLFIPSAGCNIDLYSNDFTQSTEGIMQIQVGSGHNYFQPNTNIAVYKPGEGGTVSKCNTGATEIKRVGGTAGQNSTNTGPSINGFTIKVFTENNENFLENQELSRDTRNPTPMPNTSQGGLSILQNYGNGGRGINPNYSHSLHEYAQGQQGCGVLYF